MRENFGNNVAPVSIGDEADVTIEGVGGQGDGIARISGFVIFVPKTKMSQRVRIRITKVSKNVGFGEVIGSAKTSVEKVHVATPPKRDEPEDTDDFGEDLDE